MVVVLTLFSLTLIPSVVHAQTMNLPFIPNTFPQQTCNNYSGNPHYQWKPTHGSPKGVTNTLKTELAVRDAFPSTKSKGLFIDLQTQPFTLQKDKNYAFTIYYECPDPSNVTFKLDALKNAPSEQSASDCTEKGVPSITSKQGIYTNVSNYLETSYSGQIKTLDFSFTANDNYRYLWLYSDVLANYGTNSRHVVYVTKIEVQFTGTSNSGGGSSCAQTPQNRHTIVQSANKVRLNWDEIANTPDKYQVQYKPAGSTTWTVEDVYNLTDYVWIDNLQQNTAYEWCIRSSCGSSQGQWSRIETFMTPGLSDISLTCENLPQTIYLQNLPAEMTCTGWVRAFVKHPDVTTGSIKENFEVGLPYGYEQGNIEIHPWKGPKDGIYYQDWTRIHLTNIGIYQGHNDWEWSAQYSMMQQSTYSEILIKPMTIGYITVKARRNNACGQGPWLSQIFDVTNEDNGGGPFPGGW